MSQLYWHRGEELFPTEKGKRRIEKISKMLFDKGSTISSEYLKILLSDKVPELMQERGLGLDKELVSVFARVKEIAMS